MSLYASVKGAPPVGFFVIRPEHWASSYKDRPVAALKVGLRIPGDADLTYALEIAKEWNEQLAGHENRNLITATVATCICDTEDASLAHEAFQMPDELIRKALRPETIQAMFDEIDRLMVVNSPIRLEATDEEITDLMSMIAEGVLENVRAIDEAKHARIRRYLRLCLDELNEAAEQPEVTDH